MGKRVRIKDVAEHAGVSTGTVDRVIHNRGRVDSKVKERVESVMQELGFERNLIASALAKNQTLRIGVLFPIPNTDPYWDQIFAGVAKASQFVKHYGVVIEEHHFELLDPVSFLKKAKKMIKQSYDAILFPPLFLKEGNWLLETCKKKNIPNIIINTDIENENSLGFIGQESYQSGVLAARLLNFGISRKSTVLILNLTKGTTNAKHLVEKANGFKNYFKSNRSINIVVDEFEGFASPRRLKNYFKKMHDKYPNLSGVFFTNSRVHFAIDVLNDDFLKKVKIVGFDLIEENIKHLLNNKIDFLINQNPFEQGYLGIVSLYKHLILKESIRKKEYLSLDIVVKENLQCYLRKDEQTFIV